MHIRILYSDDNELLLYILTVLFNSYNRPVPKEIKILIHSVQHNHAGTARRQPAGEINGAGSMLFQMSVHLLP